MQRKLLQGVDHGLQIVFKGSTMLPIFGFTIVCSELDDDDVWSEIACHLPGLLVHIRAISAIEQRASTHAKVAHIVVLAQ